MEFSYEEGYGCYSHILYFDTDQGMRVNICFSGLDADCLEFDEHEFKPQDDTLKSICVFVKERPLFLSDVVAMADKQIDGIVYEVLSEQEEEKQHEAYYSSPYLSGR